MNQPQKSNRPPVTRQTRCQVFDFVIQEMSDPMGHLTEEQKKWFVMDPVAPNDGEQSQPVPMICVVPRQPIATRETRGGPQEFIVQEMADPWGHLSEAMKKKIFGDAGPPAPPTPTEPLQPAPKPTEG